ncbi:MAG TPA: hypothetical protein VFX71_01585, partial [Hyphomicrobium sp.]|nr:hypothetical protein [Hyphomicrobium sp.]
LVATRAIIFDGAGRVTGLFPFAGGDHGDICRRPWAGFLLPHPAWMGRREWFVAHPYREQALKAQDQELLLRSYRESRFALIDEILLGYRQEAISVAKSLVGRRIFCEALLRQADDLAGWIMAWRGFGYHALGLVKDLLFAGRANPLRKQPTEAEIAAFSRLWREVAVQS